MKTSWRHLEDVFRLQKTFSRRLGQDGHIHYTHTSSGDVFKTSWRRFQDVLQERLLDIFKTSSKRFQDVFKTSSRHLQNVYKTFSRGLAKTSSRHLQDVFKTSSGRLQDIFKTPSRRFETCSRRLAKMSSRRCQDVSSSYTVLVNNFSRCLQDVFPTFLRCTAKTVIYRSICLGHTSEKFMISGQNL